MGSHAFNRGEGALPLLRGAVRGDAAGVELQVLVGDGLLEGVLHVAGGRGARVESVGGAGLEPARVGDCGEGGS